MCYTNSVERIKQLGEKGIDAKLKVLLAERAQSAEKEAEAPVEAMQEVSVYRLNADAAVKSVLD